MPLKKLALFFIVVLLTGFCEFAICDERPETAFVHTEGIFDRLNVRPAPSEDFPPLCKLFNGVQVRVENRDNGWAYISYGREENIAEIRGYVQEKYLDVGEGLTGVQKPLPRIRVTNDAFYIRDIGWYYPWAKHEDDMIPAGTELTVIAVKGNFDLTDTTSNFDAYFVETDDNDRFWLRNVEDFGIEVLNPMGYTAKTTDSVRMRKAADIESKVIKSLNAGAKVEILLRGEGWTMVKYQNRIGYIMSRYLLFPQ